MSEPTLRGHLQSLLPLHERAEGRCRWCETVWPCGHAVTLRAALRILDDAKTMRADPIDDALIADAIGWEHIANPFPRVRLLPDPEPS